VRACASRPGRPDTWLASYTSGLREQAMIPTDIGPHGLTFRALLRTQRAWMARLADLGSCYWDDCSSAARHRARR
jgi:hypothetical protein